MKSEELIDYLEGRRTNDELRSDLPITKGNASRTIEIEDSGAEFVVEAKHLLRVLSDFERSLLTVDEVEYVMDCLELCDDFVFANDAVRQVVFELSEPSINGALTQQRARDLIAKLKLL